jgi:hypothetical protein
MPDTRGSESFVSHGISKHKKAKIYRNTNLPVVLHGREKWPQSREKHGLRVFRKRVLRKIFELRCGK